MQIKINGKTCRAKIGETVLDVCVREGIRIPTLCTYKNIKREAACRLCLVEVNKSKQLVTSCSFKVCDGLEVTTESERIQKARNINLELLFADHAGKCAKCRKNRKCDLQALAEQNKIDNFHFVPKSGEIISKDELNLLRDNRSRLVFEDENGVITRTTEYCVSCRRCINVCPTREFGLSYRGSGSIVGTPYREKLDCIFCGACVNACPTGALTDHGDVVKIQEELDDLKKFAVAIIDISALESIAREAGLKLEENAGEKIVGMLKLLGFERVFDASFGMEKWMKMAKEEVAKSKKMIISGYCPSLVLYVKKYFPSFAENILGLPGPEDFMAEYLKTEYASKEKMNSEDIVVVSLSACVAKKKVKGEYLDHVMTPREFGRMVRAKKPESIENEKLDKLPGGGAQDEICDLSKVGGVAATVSNGKLRTISASGFEDTKKILQDVEKREVQYDFLDLMICENGCSKEGNNHLS